MRKRKNKVLVLGIDERSTLTVVRSIGRKGVCVHLGYDDRMSICRYSKFLEESFLFPSAGRYPKAWLTCLLERIKTEKYDLVIPTSDNYLVLAVKNRHLLEKYSKFAIPDNRGFEYTYKKNKTFELASALNIPMPVTKLIGSLKDFKVIEPLFQYPVVIKPISSKVWKGDTRHSLKVETAKNEIELKSKLVKILEICPVLLQSFHNGIGVGIEMLMDHGKLVAAFQHQRVHEPLKGGGSSYRKSVKLNPLLLDYSRKIMSNLKWTGVAMVEYKFNPKSNESVLMEINGRFWGSLPLAYNSGIDFPSLLFDMMVLGKKTRNFDYKETIYCRNLARDMDWLFENFTADKSDPFRITVPTDQIIKEVKNIFAGNERFDTLVMYDLKPGIIHLSRFVLKKIVALVSKIYKFTYKLNREYNAVVTFFQIRRLKKKYAKNPRVLFICKGNICRSPFAEFYLKNKLKKRKNILSEVESVGLINKTGRKSPANAIEAAASFGVNLSAHKSKVLNGELIKRFGVIYIMDIELYRRIKSIYPNSKYKLFYLKEMEAKYPRKIEIKDPYGQSVGAFNTVYKQIARSLDNTLELIQ